MNKEGNNFAFIDNQNIYQGVKELGWYLDWRKFRRYLAEKYAVKKAYLFLGHIVENEKLYRLLKADNFILKFKEVSKTPAVVIKGNVDVDLTLQVMIDLPLFSQAIIVTSDGDFSPLVSHLYTLGKLRTVLSPHVANCSHLLKHAARERIEYLNKTREKVGYVK